MSALPKTAMTADEFLAWVATQPREAGRHELLDGHVVTMQSERLIHTEVKFALASVFRDAIRKSGRPCHALPDGAHVRLNKARAFQPDTLVYCGARHPPDVIEVPNPIIVCEVLSPESLERDLGEKLEGYFTVPSIQHYLIVDPDRQRVIHHRRGSGEDLITRIYKGGTLTIEPPGLNIDVNDLFDRAAQT